MNWGNGYRNEASTCIRGKQTSSIRRRSRSSLKWPESVSPPKGQITSSTCWGAHCLFAGEPLCCWQRHKVVLARHSGPVGNPLHPMQPSVRSSRFTWCWCDRVPFGLARPGPAIAACREQSMSYSFRMFVLCWASAGKPVKSGLHGTSAASVEAASRSFTAGEPAGRHSCCLRYGPLSDIFAGGPDRGKDLPMAQLAMVARAERW